MLARPLCLALSMWLTPFAHAQSVGAPVPTPEARPDGAGAEAGSPDRATRASTETETETDSGTGTDPRGGAESPSPEAFNEANSRANGAAGADGGTPIAQTTEPDASGPAVVEDLSDPDAPAAASAPDPQATAPVAPSPTPAGLPEPDGPEPDPSAPQSLPIRPGDIPRPEAKPETAAAKAAPIGALDTAEPPAIPVLPKPSAMKQQPISPAAAVRAAAAIIASEACEADLTRRGIVFETEPSLNEGDCGVLRPVSLTTLSSGLEVNTQTLMWCPTADALDTWMTETVIPAAEAVYPDRTLTGISRISTYVCRNRGSGQKISEHARGSAVDIGAFVFEDGEVPVAAANPETPDGKFLSAVRAGACGPFTTVLGPGTDADHATHFHFDLAARKGGPYCR
ncbi:extensin family protein [Fulvimarina sp. 2208YS6-2-32]|uniref:Extensin family protein n=1 Tax=Fulvimarina uroteuthidis TaxID=3098149 RepID=A0ABU5I2J5_9HYPH|nr:extensin family protein [Fulvimarina sp. 2208YS6-2-32]MDY8109315.1 extensin family protein [Fulvimarina sp. 2208YS6-2-32]